MIFTGDISLPFPNAINYASVIDKFHNKHLFCNLEGSLLDQKIDHLKSGVYNDVSAIEQLQNNLNIVGFALANNHITDSEDFESTFKLLEEFNIPYCGAGLNIEQAQKELKIEIGGRTIIIANFGWEVIQCKIASKNFPGVNPLIKNHVLRCIERLVHQYPDAFIIPFMHWSYELEGEPQPFERELAKKMIEAGASGVVGCHPHRVGGFEMYNGKPIIYSLGNWLFMQNYYHSGRLSFPDFCNKQLAFEWNFLTGEMLFHFFLYNKKKSLLEYQYTEDINSPTMKKLTPFEGLSNEEYKIWYKKNHYHKNKGLPIYFYEDSELTIKMKNGINKLRDFGVGLIRGVRK